MTLRIGIIGAGGRVKQTVLPAVWALGERARIVQINTRTPRQVDLPDGSQIGTVTSLDDLSFEAIDVLIVAVGTKSVRPILEKLGSKQHKERVTLVMDTPPLRFSDLRRTRLYKGFGNVTVGEDWIKLTPVLAAKRIIELGEIGDLHSIRLDHLSYRYHGLATVKELASVNVVSSIRRRPLGGPFFENTIKLGSVVATTVEPRDYNNGRMLITGGKGFISDFGIGVGGRKWFRIEYPETKEGWFQPTLVNAEAEAPDDVERYMATLPFDYLEDPAGSTG